MAPVVLLALFAFLHQPVTSRQPLPGQPCTAEALVGTWQFVERTEGPAPDLGDLTVYKHVTPTHFFVTRVDPRGTVASAHGGTHSLAGGTYTERVDQATSHERYAGLTRGTAFAFQCAIDGDQWRIAGEFQGQTYAERWRRARAAGAP